MSKAIRGILAFLAVIAALTGITMIYNKTFGSPRKDKHWEKIKETIPGSTGEFSPSP